MVFLITRCMVDSKVSVEEGVLITFNAKTGLVVFQVPHLISYIKDKISIRTSAKVITLFLNEIKRITQIENVVLTVFFRAS